MVVLYQLPGAWGASSISPFCIKVEAFLRMAKIPFESRFGDPRKAPRKKVPWIDDEGELIADSERILRHLVSKYQVELDAALSDDQRTLGHALRRMLEESTYWGLVALRWADPVGWGAYRPEFMKLLPPVIGGSVLWMVRRQLLAQLWSQGTGRYEPGELHEILVRDFAALSQALGDKPFLLGSEPTSHDATAFAFLKSLCAFPAPSPVKDFALRCSNLVAYEARIRSRFF